MKKFNIITPSKMLTWRGVTFRTPKSWICSDEEAPTFERYLKGMNVKYEIKNKSNTKIIKKEMPKIVKVNEPPLKKQAIIKRKEKEVMEFVNIPKPVQKEEKKILSVDLPKNESKENKKIEDKKDEVFVDFKKESKNNK